MAGCLRCLTSEDDLDPCPPDGTCARCGHRWVRPPFFAVSGATGVGKSTACAGLPALGFVALDGDLLWQHEYWESNEGVAAFYRAWLRFGVPIGQSGHPLVLGTAVIPARWEPLVERSYVSEIHYVALVADPDVHRARLLGRDPDAEASDPHFDGYLAFNRWLRENGPATNPPMTLLDTTHATPSQTTAAVAAWIRSRLSPS